MTSGETSAGLVKTEAVVLIKEEDIQEGDSNIIYIFDQVDFYYSYISIIYRIVDNLIIS